MLWQPEEALSERKVNRAKKLVIADGLVAEAMTTLTSGTFLMALILLLNASNFQIGLLAGLPTFTNIFQLLSIWLIRRFNNRRMIAVLSALLARLPLLLIGALALVFHNLPVQVIIFILFFHYFFGSLAGPCWNSWMKDLIPENEMGAYFSRRGSYTQFLNVIMGLTVAFVVDYVKDHRLIPELNLYALLFIGGGIAGIISALILSATPEPRARLATGNVFKQLLQPLKDGNFKKLLIFNSAWVFAINIASPFFIVFLMKSMGLSLSYVIGFSIVSQIASILTIRIWGRSSDKYSNKTVIAICAPLYLVVLIAWCFVGIYTRQFPNLLLLFIIYVVTGVATAGVNLSLTNISLKLSPSNQSVAYLSTKNIITAFFAFIAPLIGGYLADFFGHRSISIDARWKGPHTEKVLHLLNLHEWNFLFLIAAVLGFVAVELLINVKETGEVEKDVVVRMMRSSIRNNLKEYFIISQLVSLHETVRNFVRRKGAKTDMK
jgi:MFS family permease